MEVDAVLERAADFAEVALDDAAGTAAFAAEVPIVATRTSVQLNVDVAQFDIRTEGTYFDQASTLTV